MLQNATQQADNHLEQGPNFPKVDIRDSGLFYPREHTIGYNL
jgi:hypothetical protein